MKVCLNYEVLQANTFMRKVLPDMDAALGKLLRKKKEEEETKTVTPATMKRKEFDSARQS